MRRIISHLICLTLILNMGNATVFAAACGNGVCEKPLESCSTCSRDCGVCAVCGDGKCSTKETCFRCPEDCGACPVDDVCGDGVCSDNESCSSCSEDCGTCAEGSSWRDRLFASFAQYQRLLRRTGRYIVRFVNTSGEYAALVGKLPERLGEDAIERQQAAQDLLDFLDANPHIAERITSNKISSLEKTSVEEDPSFLNVIPSIQASRSVRTALKRESSTLVKTTEELLQNKELAEEFAVLSEFDSLDQALAENDFETVLAVLPEPKKSLPALKNRVSDFLEVFELQEDSEPIAFMMKAFAQATEEEISAKKAFQQSVKLGQQMHRIAQDPDQKLPSLEERLNYLQNRRVTIGEVVNIAPNDVDERIDAVRSGAKDPSTTKLLDLMGMLRFLKESPNFQELEQTYAQATIDMQQGAGRIRSVLVGGVSPPVEAAEVLTDAWGADVVASLKTGTVEEQKKIIWELLQKEDEKVQEMIDKLPDAMQNNMNAALANWNDVFLQAKTTMELRLALRSRTLLLQNIQKESRAQRNLIFRLFSSFNENLFGDETIQKAAAAEILFSEHDAELFSQLESAEGDLAAITAYHAKEEMADISLDLVSYAIQEQVEEESAAAMILRKLSSWNPFAFFDASSNMIALYSN